MNIVTHNIVAQNAQRQFTINSKAKEKATERLASGYRINRAADDAAGLSISEKMRHQIRGLGKGSQNIQDGISLVQVADGALSTVHSILDRMIELSVQAANDTNTPADRQALQNEMSELAKEIDRIGESTTFNTKQIFHVPEAESYDGSITELIRCPEADKGYLVGSYLKNGKYYAAATMDYGNVTPNNLAALNGAGFSFSCSMSCSEIFDIKFITGEDGTKSTATNLTGATRHLYKVDISDCKNGTDIVNKVYDFIGKHLPSTANAVDGLGDLMVSHSNNLAKNGSKLVVYSNLNSWSTASAAENAFKSRMESNSPYSKIECSQISFQGEQPDFQNHYTIQCSSDPKDTQEITTHQLDQAALGMVGMNISTGDGAQRAIGVINNAIATVSDWRSDLGATQNRLEHSYAANENTAENLQAAESRLRDANMADEVVEMSKQSILQQTAQAMISQASHQPEQVLSLLQ